MNECWINVYRCGTLGGRWPTRFACEVRSLMTTRDLAYRLHVRMKPQPKEK
jgi:hypothetical protein